MHDPKRPRREGRRHNISPAPPPRDQFDLLKGLDEALGLTLWRAVRDVLLWADTPSEERVRLFQPMNENVRDRTAYALVAAPELREAFGTFAFLRMAPDSVSARQLAAACQAVSAWADRHTLTAVAVHFMEAAAAAEPNDPALAVDAGWICRRVARQDYMERSAAWYQRAFALAVRSRNRKEAIRSLTGYGALMKDLGRVEEARTAYQRAARRAKRTGRRRQAAVSHHYLFALAAETGSIAEAVEQAEHALVLYPVHDERLPYLVHDFSYLLVRHGYYRAAARLEDMVSARLDRPDELVLVFGVAARAAAGAGFVQRFQSAEQAVCELVGLYEEYAPSALINVAEGARLLRSWDRAERYAELAVGSARARRDSVLEEEATVLLSGIRNREAGLPAADLRGDTRIARLARRLAARLRRWHPRNPGTGP